MSFQIKEIIIVGRNGDVRRIGLRIGGVSIITGDSATGKSALSKIIEYCLGSSRCDIPEGPIRRAAAWYALVLSVGQSEALIARRAPAIGEGTSLLAYVESAAKVKLPSAHDLQENTNVDGLVDFVTKLAGITSNSVAESSKEQRQGYDASIKHALWYCFQAQNEIASPDVLFHKQGEEGHPQSIRDSLPYFLGAIPSDVIELRSRLWMVRGKLREIEVRVEQAEATLRVRTMKGRALYDEAVAEGLLVGPPPSDTAKLLESMRMISLPSISADGRQEEDGVPAAAALRKEEEELRDQLVLVQDRIATLTGLVAKQAEVSGELALQSGRYEGLGLLPKTKLSTVTCPLCGEVPTHPPATLLNLVAGLEQLSEEMRDVSAASTKAEEQLRGLRATQDDVRTKLQGIRQRLASVMKEQSVLSEQRDVVQRRTHVHGRISYFLEQVSALDSLALLIDERAQLERQVSDLEGKIGDQALRDKVRSQLAIIAEDVSRGAKVLELEHSEFPLRLDINNLTLLAQTPDGAFRLSQIGSGANWVGYHLCVMLSLHSWFQRRQRPVPRFLFLDQPSQAYYPADVRGANYGEREHMLVKRLFRFIYDEVARAKGAFQVIITDHAAFEDTWFRESVVETFRGGNKLIPENWL